MKPHPIKDYIELDLGSGPLKLNLGFHALVLFEERRGKNAGEAFVEVIPDKGESAEALARRVLKGVSVTDLATMVHCLLNEHHADQFTFQQAANLINPFNVGEIYGQIQRAVSAFYGGPEEGAKPGPFVVARRTGKPSGRSVA